ncbi:hypothetical protein C8R44DRAFT_878582 [Mycena epipterygia]|nr:hypothetical protein C8R44DRAFT_878582 [Mycena epipterygia]
MSVAYYPPTHFAQQTPSPARPRPREQTLRCDTSVDTCLFVPGLYRFPTPPPTPAAILSGAYHPAAECIECFPRRAKYCGRPCLSITFAVHGHPAPYLKEIFKDRVLLDGAHDAVMADHGWSRTRWVLEWPGYESRPRGLMVTGLTREALAKEIAATVALFLRNAALEPAPLPADSPWAPRNVHFGDIRLVALNYYGRVWAPVLAFDAA